MTDLCQLCQQNSIVLTRSASTPEEERSEVSNLEIKSSSPDKINTQIVKRAEEHLTLATKARSYMRSQVDMSKKELEREFTGEDGVLQVPPIGCFPHACSKSIKIHFSFDFAQQVCAIEHKFDYAYTQDSLQVHYPHSPQQPGPIYFLTPRKCGIFGVTCEAIPRQVRLQTPSIMSIISGVHLIE